MLKALALGARFVFLGRPFMYAAAVAGAPGVRHAIGLLRSDLDRNMAMIGSPTIVDVNSEILA